MLHAADYKGPGVLAGKRVLVVGGGNSGCVLAVEAVHFAERTILSLRRGYYFVPKYIFGQPSDRFADRFAAIGIPLKLRRLLFSGVLRLIVGSPRRFGLPQPDHRLFETHPIINSLLPYYVRHGNVQVRPDIRRFEKQTVVFEDGSRDEVDIAIFTTGYELAFPFIDPAHLNWRDGRPQLYKNVFHPEYDNLFVAGMIQPDSGQFGLVHWQTLAVARFLALRRSRSPVADRFGRLKREVDEDLGHGIRYEASSRHLLEVEHWSYLKGMKKTVRKLPPIHA
jgi:cation diffusion facilitator CzcD-associated flavoprotein CzcO